MVVPVFRAGHNTTRTRPKLLDLVLFLQTDNWRLKAVAFPPALD